MIEFNSNKILLLGDCHGLRNVANIIRYKPNLDNRTILQIGDFGLGFCPKSADEKELGKINEDCKKRNILLYVQRGNHDNESFWLSSYNFSNLFLVPDYTEAIFPNGKTALLVGGGISIDRPVREVGRDYWPTEKTKYKKVNKKFDVLFSHDCPDYFNHNTESLLTSPYAAFLKMDRALYKDALDQRLVMNQIVEDINCKEIYSGHYHNSLQESVNSINYRCLDIEEIYEYNSF